jgi:hypothetical protein
MFTPFPNLPPEGKGPANSCIRGKKFEFQHLINENEHEAGFSPLGIPTAIDRFQVDRGRRIVQGLSPLGETGKGVYTNTEVYDVEATGIVFLHHLNPIPALSLQHVPVLASGRRPYMI